MYNARIVLMLLALVATTACGKTMRIREDAPLRIATKMGEYAFHGNSSRIDVTPEGHEPWRLELSIESEAGPIPLRLGDTAVRDRAGHSYKLVAHAKDTLVKLTVDVDEAQGTVRVTPVVDKGALPVSLRLDAVTTRAPFVPGVGVSPEGTSSGPFAVIDPTLAAGFLKCNSRVTTTRAESQDAGVSASAGESTPLHLVLGRDTPNNRVECAGATLFLAAGTGHAPAIAHAYFARGVELHRVHARVTGGGAKVQLFALDRSAKPVFRLPWQGAAPPAANEPLTFDFEAPSVAEAWFAANEATETSPTRAFVPGVPGDLVLDVSPGGELAIRVIDPDSSAKKLVSRVFVRGIDGTADPSFGPDHRGTGAGPLMDLPGGEVTTPLPQGRYRVRATKGIEWSIDSTDITVAPGETTRVDLELRRVAASAHHVGCDLHVHARPSFDSPVTMEERVLSLAAQGVGFAVPTEHNVVGNYAPGIALLDLQSELSTVTGVEVTTYDPRFGHFGVFPYPLGAGVPPYRGSNAGAVFAAARRGDARRVVQVNHPRMGNGIGYFNVMSFDPKSGTGTRTDFDTIEVYNGYEMFDRDRVELVLRDFMALLNRGAHVAATGSSDSHRIQYQWAGYPRTMARAESRADTADVVAAIKAGRSFVTSGPMLDVQIGGKDPGAEISVAPGARVPVRVRVVAAPWIDVRSVEIIQNGERAAERTVPERTMSVGRQSGTLDEARARTVRFDEEIEITAAARPDKDSWIIVIVRGDRRMDDAIPFMPVQPLAFTNPVMLRIRR